MEVKKFFGQHMDSGLNGPQSMAMTQYTVLAITRGGARSFKGRVQNIFMGQTNAAPPPSKKNLLACAEAILLISFQFSK